MHRNNVQLINRQKGIALIAVLSFLGVMSLLAIAIVGASRTTVYGAQRLLTRAQAQAAIESAIEVSALELTGSSISLPAILREPQRIAIGGFDVLVAARRERGKIDINFADAATLASLFSAAGADPDQAQALAAAVEDWRDADSLIHLKGAEKPHYERAGRMDGPSNKPFGSVNELRRVLGMSSQIFDCLRPELTVLTQAPGVEVAAASPIVLQAMGVGTANSAGLSAPIASDQLITPGEVFEITATVENAALGIRRGERVSVRATGDPADPFWVLDVEPLFPLLDAARMACPSKQGDRQ